MTSKAAELAAGRELDALVAEKVFGLVPCTSNCHGVDWLNIYCYALPESPDQGGEVRLYSSDIAAAWEVVEKLQDEWTTTIENDGTGDWWGVTFWMGDTFHSAQGNSAPLAICRAALAVANTSDSTR